jgi:hypothetical protein
VVLTGSEDGGAAGNLEVNAGDEFRLPGRRRGVWVSAQGGWERLGAAQPGASVQDRPPLLWGRAQGARGGGGLAGRGVPGLCGRLGPDGLCVGRAGWSRSGLRARPVLVG